MILTTLNLSPNATASVNINDRIAVGENVTIIVTAQNGSTQTYNLRIVAKTKAILTNLMTTNIGADNISVSTSYESGNTSTTKYGFVYSNTISGRGLVIGEEGIITKTISGTLVGNDFRTTLRNLNHSTTYYMKAYATNAAGTSYSNEVSVITETPEFPELQDLITTRITAVTATFTTPFTSNTALTEYGVIYSPTLTGTALTITGTKIVGTIENPTTNLEVTFNNFTPNTLYYARAYAINSEGINYSNNYVTLRTEMLRGATFIRRSYYR